jgi:hypothetical protein
MKKITTILALAASLLSQAQTASEQKAWETYMTPSNGHKMLEKEVGHWEGNVQFWANDTAAPQSYKASYDVKMILNGLFQEMEYKSIFMGMPFLGKSITGYNNHKKEYEVLWVDGMGSGFIKMNGFWDEGTQTFNFKGTQTDPITGKDVDIRQETKIVSPTNFIVTMYGPGINSTEMKFMEGNFIKTFASSNIKTTPKTKTKPKAKSK